MKLIKNFKIMNTNVTTNKYKPMSPHWINLKYE